MVERAWKCEPEETGIVYHRNTCMQNLTPRVFAGECGSSPSRSRYGSAYAILRR
jgi:hypothetical protein